MANKTLEEPLCETFYGIDGDANIKVVLISPYSNGQWKVRFGDEECGKFLTRHKDRLKPLNDSAKSLLGKE